jgi:hypothetical protein
MMITIYALMTCAYIGTPNQVCTLEDLDPPTLEECHRLLTLESNNIRLNNPRGFPLYHFTCVSKQVPAWEPAE